MDVLVRKYRQLSIHLDKRGLLIAQNRYLELILVFSMYVKVQESGVMEILPETGIWLSRGLFI